MHVRFTRSVAAPVLAAILGCVVFLSDVARADSGNGVLSILPPSSTLTGRRATAQLVATARGADGSVQDQTRRLSGSARTRRSPRSQPRAALSPRAMERSRSSLARGASRRARPSRSRPWISRPA